LKELLQITKALADENRLRIIMMVKDREPCVCQIVEVLGTAPSTASKHLSILKAAGLIDYYKEGRWIYYHLPRNPEPLVKDTLHYLFSNLENSEVVQKDLLHFNNICELEPGCLTIQQRKGRTDPTNQIKTNREDV
jgi:ArsR family transcriptional regulator, arsenate/arsenite/antimonite-responsive transcriptional repressor